MGISKILPPAPQSKPGVASVDLPVMGSPRTVPAAAESVAPTRTRDWFRSPVATQASGQNEIPVPTAQNRVECFIGIQSYYVALGKAIRRTRDGMADFVYIAGWELDLNTYVDPEGALERATLGELLYLACVRKVEVRVLLDSTTNRNANYEVAQTIGQIGGGQLLIRFIS